MGKVARFVAATTLAFSSLFIIAPAQAEQVMAEITCQAPDGTTRVDMVGWDNTAEFFMDRGYIPRLWCEGGYAGPGYLYVSDNLASPSLGYYSGLVPTPTPTVEPSPQPSPTPSPEPSPSSSPSDNGNTGNPDPEPSVTPPSLEPEPTREPQPQPTAETTPELEPVVSPEPEKTQPSVAPSKEPQPPVVEPPLPLVEPSPEPPVIEPIVPQTTEEVLAELAEAAEADDPVVPQELAAIPLLGNAAVAILDTFNALGNIGADMEPEVRATAQKAVVSSVIVGQIATTASLTMGGASYRRMK